MYLTLMKVSVYIGVQGIALNNITPILRHRVTKRDTPQSP